MSLNQSSTVSARKRVLFIGGGPASLAAAFQLTGNEPEAYDITIYEMSWRLGGKTASGRDASGRIEEHGLHILFGCYHNVFRTMIRCYDELRAKKLVSPELHSLQHFHDAVVPHHFGVIGDDRKDPWAPIYIQFPSNFGVPGDPPLPGFCDLCVMGLQIGWMIIVGGRSLRVLQRKLSWLLGYKARWAAPGAPARGRAAGDAQSPSDELGGDLLSRMFLRGVLTLLDKRTCVGGVSVRVAKHAHHWLRRLRFAACLPPLERLWSAVDFMLALFRGLSIHAVSTTPGGFERIDAYDLRTWLHRHGASLETLGSPWMRIIYDAAFSYPLGGLPPQNSRKLPPGLNPKGLYELIGAGAALRSLMLMSVTYKGAFYNKMAAGMGDVLHTPLYLVLRDRGVKFEFFHRLTDLKPGRDESGRAVIDAIELQTLPDPEPYDPLISVGKLRCWPASPNLAALRQSNHPWARQAESYAPEGARHGEKTLRRCEFDAVVLGIPVACLPYACPSLLAAEAQQSSGLRPSFRDQAQIDVVQTVALQLWLKPELTKLGWEYDSPLLSLFIDPLNTWCDMSHLLPYEGWQDLHQPGSIAYFCGALPHENGFPRPGGLEQAPAVRARIDAQVRAASLGLLTAGLSTLWPTASSVDGFSFNLLVDPQNQKGEQRLSSQYIRANYEPHALCTLALPGKTQFRMKTDATGHDNLFVTGDWIDNGVHVACVEGAFHAGIRCARAIAARFGGRPELYRAIAEGLLGLEVLSSKAKAVIVPKHPARSQQLEEETYAVDA